MIWRILKRGKQAVTGHPIYVDNHLSSRPQLIEQFQNWGQLSEHWSGSPRILFAAGHGYGNVGDEAQCGACITRWKKVRPDCKITLFTPNPAFTHALHDEHCEWAPRVGWFGANRGGPYFASDRSFRRSFFLISQRILLSARMLRRGIPLMFCHPREARVLSVIQNHDLLHISGGGFLTGKTRSRLWENCLLMKVCQILGVPYMLTGQTIGVFNTSSDRRLAKAALSKAMFIGLRDRGLSAKDLDSIGISGDHVQSICDDALLCDSQPKVQVEKTIQQAGANPGQPWVAINFHHWGQDKEKIPKIEARFAAICDELTKKHGRQLIFIPMTPSDVQAQESVIKKMTEPAFLMPYNPDYRVVRGVITFSDLVLTFKHHPIVFAQGENTPIVGIALDKYYEHKNKGALANTGHEDLLVDREGFYGDQVDQLVSRVIRDKIEIEGQLAKWTGEMRKIELQPYLDAISQIES